MAEIHGIKETREVIAAIATLTGAIRLALEDGQANASDLFTLIANEDIRNALMAAAQGIKDVQTEIGDLSISEIRVLVDDAFDVVIAATGIET